MWRARASPVAPVAIAVSSSVAASIVTRGLQSPVRHADHLLCVSAGAGAGAGASSYVRVLAKVGRVGCPMAACQCGGSSRGGGGGCAGISGNSGWSVDRRSWKRVVRRGFGWRGGTRAMDKTMLLVVGQETLLLLLASLQGELASQRNLASSSVRRSRELQLVLQYLPKMHRSYGISLRQS